MLTANKEMKREVKRIMKKQIADKTRNRLKNRVPGVLIHSFQSDIGYGFEDHKILIAAGTAEEALRKLERVLPVHGQTMTPSAYDCTGEPFNDPAEVKQVAPNRFLVKLNIHFDV